MEVSEREVAALFTLLRRRPRGVSWAQVAADVAFEGSAAALLDAGEGDALFPAPGGERDLAEAEAEISRWRDQGHRFVTVLDGAYPSRLRDIRETPPFLFYEGNLRAEDDGMSVVGSRAPSAWGLEFAAEVARLLVAQHLTVIAGLAAGIDTAAHRAALDSRGRTVAFIGTGIAQAYPPQNVALQREIADRGLVLSQFYPDAPPNKRNFPVRNASMSGYGLATIVVEAGEYSGSRIQARLAGEHGRPAILTSRVAESTSWGRELATAPHVHVVRDIDELATVVDKVRESPKRLRSALRELVEA